jgi:four helix bundle protein
MQERKKVRSFEDLFVWQMGIDLVKHLRPHHEGDFSRDFGLRDQLRRASVSVPTNIAEGFELSSRKEYLRHLNIAKGSAGEVRSLLRVAWDVGYIDGCQYRELKDAAMKLSAYLFNHMKSVRNALPKN